MKETAERFGAACWMLLDGDVAWCVVLGVSLMLVSEILRRTVFWPTSRWLSLEGEVAHKFVEECWSMVWHSAMLGLEVYALYGEPWFHSSVSPWTAPEGTMPFWTQGPVQTSRSLRLLYLVQLAYFFEDTIYMYLYDRKKKNLGMFVTHHIAATLLVLVSYFPPPCEFTLIGSGILLLHEVSDVFLYAARLFRFFNMAVPTMVTFVMTTLTWFWFRIVCLPRIIYSAAFESPEQSVRQKVCASLLAVLYVLHIDWFRQLLVVLWNAVSGKGMNDPTRSDYVDPDKHKDKASRSAPDTVRNTQSQQATARAASPDAHRRTRSKKD